MRVPFNLSSNETKIPFEVPQKWEDISTEEFVRLKTVLLQDEPNIGPSVLLNVFTGLEQKFWQSMDPAKYAEPLEAILRFWNLEKPPSFMKLEVPDLIHIDGKSLKVEKEVTQHSLGVIETMTGKFTRWAKEGHIKNGTLDELIIFAPEVVALFMQLAYDRDEMGKEALFDEERSKLLIPFINKLPAVQTIPLACFFLSGSLQLLNNGLKILSRTPTTSRKKPGRRR